MTNQMKKCPDCGHLSVLAAPQCACGRVFRSQLTGDDERTRYGLQPAAPAMPAAGPDDVTIYTGPAFTPAIPTQPAAGPKAGAVDSERLAKALRLPFWLVLIALVIYLVIAFVQTLTGVT